MIDLKLSKKEKKDRNSQTTGTLSDTNNYPYGIELHFETEQIKKLGLEDMTAGQIAMVHAKAKVTRVNVTDKGKDDKIRTIDIQLQGMEIMSEDNDKKKMRKEIGEEVFAG